MGPGWISDRPPLLGSSWRPAERQPILPALSPTWALTRSCNVDKALRTGLAGADAVRCREIAPALASFRGGWHSWGTSRALRVRARLWGSGFWIDWPGSPFSTGGPRHSSSSYSVCRISTGTGGDFFTILSEREGPSWGDYPRMTCRDAIGHITPSPATVGSHRQPGQLLPVSLEGTVLCPRL